AQGAGHGAQGNAHLSLQKDKPMMNTEAVMGHAVARTDARDVAVAMLKQRRSAAEVWDALTERGVTPDAAEALVKELIELREQADSQYVAIPRSMRLGQILFSLSGRISRSTFWMANLSALGISLGYLFAVGMLIAAAQMSSHRPVPEMSLLVLPWYVFVI